MFEMFLTIIFSLSLFSVAFLILYALCVVPLSYCAIVLYVYCVLLCW